MEDNTFILKFSSDQRAIWSNLDFSIQKRYKLVLFQLPEIHLPYNCAHGITFLYGCLFMSSDFGCFNSSPVQANCTRNSCPSLIYDTDIFDSLITVFSAILMTKTYLISGI